MNKVIIEWINENAEDIKISAIVLGCINLIILGLVGCTGEFLNYFLHIVNVIFVNVTLFIPMVFATKFIRR